MTYGTWEHGKSPVELSRKMEKHRSQSHYANMRRRRQVEPHGGGEGPRRAHTETYTTRPLLQSVGHESGPCCPHLWFGAELGREAARPSLLLQPVSWPRGTSAPGFLGPVSLLGLWSLDCHIPTGFLLSWSDCFALTLTQAFPFQFNGGPV